MPNRRLTADELLIANEMLANIRLEIADRAGGDPELLFALRRKIAKELVYDERDKPMVRRALKKRMRALQGGLCAQCRNPLPDAYCVLDRFKAIDGYVESNVRLICQPCDQAIQIERRYA